MPPHLADGILSASGQKAHLRDEGRAETVILREGSEFLELGEGPRLHFTARERAVENAGALQSLAHLRAEFTLSVPPLRASTATTRTFLNWFNKPTNTDPVLKAGQAHLWFVTIHPFDDGNGRLARAIADMSLARSENSPQRFYSISAQIQQERAAYYDILERTQKGTLDITPWMDWFLGCLGRAIDGAQTTLAAVLAKARFWESIAGVAINERQRLVLNRLVDGFQGKLTTSKYAKLAKCSQDTALRDILPLVERGILVRGPEGGRSTSYALAPIS